MSQNYRGKQIKESGKVEYTKFHDRYRSKPTTSETTDNGQLEGDGNREEERGKGRRKINKRKNTYCSNIECFLYVFEKEYLQTGS